MRQHAAEPVHQRQRQRRHQRQRVHERRLQHRGAHADVADPAGPHRELARFGAGSPNSLTSVAPGAENRSVIWVFIVALWIGGLAGQLRHRRADPAGRQQEQRHQHQRQQRDLPRDAEHHRQRQRQRDDVGHHAGQRVGERPLRAHHVVAQPADQRAGAGPGEERDRHPLHVVEHRGAQVEDQALADRRRQPARHQRHRRLGDGDRGDHRAPAARPSPTAPPPAISSTTRPASSGVATASSALTTLTATNTRSLRWCRPANRQIRAISRRSASERRSPPRACVCRYSDCRATVSKLISSP